MAINSPHGEKANERPSAPNDSEDVQDNPRESQTGASTEMLFEENKDRGPSSNLGSQENLASATSSPFPFSSPRASFDPSSSQSDSPVSSPHLHSSSQLSSTSSLLSPYQQNANISVEQLNELALQDSENNNVDENSNQGFDQYAQVSQEYVPNQSVRPRVRAPQSGRDQPDRVPMSFEQRVRRRSRSNSFSHRRNLSEDLACSPTNSFSFDDDKDFYPENDRLPRLPNYEERRNDWSSPQLLPRRDAFLQSVTSILPLNLRGGGYGPQPPPGPESIENDAADLLSNFTNETLQRNRLQSDPSILPLGFRNPALYNVGRELRQLADKFAETEERKRVQLMAERVHLESINMENFFSALHRIVHGWYNTRANSSIVYFCGRYSSLSCTQTGVSLPTGVDELVIAIFKRAHMFMGQEGWWMGCCIKQRSKCSVQVCSHCFLFAWNSCCWGIYNEDPKRLTVECHRIFMKFNRFYTIISFVAHMSCAFVIEFI